MTKKELIYEAAVKLFAERGYHAVGIREIAREAGVNSAMISYYFKGKDGLLREIFSQFTYELAGTFERSSNSATSRDSLIANSIRYLLMSARENRAMYLVGLRELNRRTDVLQEIRENLDRQCGETFERVLERLKLQNVRDEEAHDMEFTTFLGMIFADYLLGGGEYIDDDVKMEKYIGIITSTLLNGALRE